VYKTPGYERLGYEVSGSRNHSVEVCSKWVLDSNNFRVHVACSFQFQHYAMSFSIPTGFPYGKWEASIPIPDADLVL